MRVLFFLICFSFGTALSSNETANKTLSYELPAKLSEAAEKGDVAVLKKLLTQVKNIARVRYKGCSPLYYAALNGKVEAVKMLIDAGAMIDKYGSKCSPIYFACLMGDLDVIKEFISSGAELNGSNSNGHTPLITAVAKGHTALVEELIAAGAKVNVQTKTGVTALWIASYYGYDDIVGVLISAGAEVNKGRASKSSLRIASRRGYTDIVKRLIAAGAEINEEDDRGYTSLVSAIESGSTDVACELIRVGAEINTRKGTSYSPLKQATDRCNGIIIHDLINAGVKISKNDAEKLIRKACWNHCLEFFKELASAGLGHHVKDASFDCLFHLSGDYSDPKKAKRVVELVRLLIAMGADTTSLVGAWLKDQPPFGKVHTPDQIAFVEEVVEGGLRGRLLLSSEKTPLVRVIKLAKKRLGDHLLTVREVDRPDEQGLVPLHWASIKGDKEIVEKLLSKGASAYQTDIRGFTPLFYAAKYGHLDILKLLITEKAQVNSVSITGITPLHLAVLNSHLLCCRWLLAAGAQVNVPNENMVRPIHLAVLNGESTLVDMLIKAGAAVRRAACAGVTPLHIAAAKGYTDIVKKLIAHKARIDEEDEDGRTPLYYAGRSGHLDTVKLLISSGALPNYQSKECSETVLDSASKNRHNEVVLHLLSIGTEVKSPSRCRNMKSIHYASMAGDTHVVKMLIALGVDVDRRAEGYELFSTEIFPLLLAAKYGHTDVVKELISAGANVHQFVDDYMSDTPSSSLSEALRRGNVDIANILRDAGASEMRTQFAALLGNELGTYYLPLVVTFTWLILLRYVHLNCG